MADGLSIAASIVAVLDLSAKVVRYAKAVKDGSSERAQLLKDIVNIQGSLHSLQSHIEMSNPNDPWVRAVQELDRPGGPLETYKAALQRLLDKLGPQDDTKKRNMLKTVSSTLSWPFQTGEVASILATIERQQRLFTLAISLDSMTLSRAIKADVHDNKLIHRVMTSDLKQARTSIQEILERSRSEAESRVLKWLSTMQPTKDHHDISSRRTPGTGEWVKKTKAFLDWFEGIDTNNVLWCSGIPGSGKTFIASMVIDYLFNIADDKQAKVAYIYCDYRSYEKDRKEALLNMIGSILRQFMALEEHLPTTLLDVFDQSGKLAENVRVSRLEEILLTFCNDHATYIVIDALDESGHTGDRRQFLKVISNLENTRAKMFYTTRPGQKDIVRHLKTRPSIQIEASESDIRGFLHQRIQERMEEEEELEDLLTHDFKEEIISSLVARAHGMFLLPDLQIRVVLDQISAAKIREALTALPEALEDQFEATVQRVRNQPKDRRDIAMKTLMWVGRTFGTLDVSDLQHALSVDPGDACLDHSKLTPLSLLRSSIVDFCQGLIAIQKDTSQVRLVHYTLHEYFDAHNQAWYSSSERMIAEVCLTYLMYDAFASTPPQDDESYQDFMRLYPFYWYASSKWGIHIHRLGHHGMPPSVAEMVSRLVFSPKHLHRAAQGLLIGSDPPSEGLSQEYARNMTPVHFAAYFGIPTLFRQAIGRGFEVNAAITEGRVIGWTPIHWVAENVIGDSCGSWMTDYVVDHGGNLNIRIPRNGDTALHMTARTGRSETLKALLAHKADQEISNEQGWRALHLAASSGIDEAVLHLLHNGCEINPRIEGTGSTPLHLAIGVGRDRMVRSLLDHGAHIKVHDQFGDTPLHIAARRGLLSIVTLLLDKGADIEAQNGYFGTPVMVASSASENSADCVRLLIKRGAIVTGRTRKNDSALVFAAKDGHIEAVEALLDAGADILGQYEEADTVLHVAAGGGHESVCQLLLKRGAIIEAKNDYGNTPLQLVNGSEGVARLLLEHGADVTAQNLRGETALHLCARSDADDDMVMRLLLQHGANIAANDFEGQTPLHTAAMYGKATMVNAMLREGASPSIIDQAGSIALHLAVRESAAATQLLIEGGSAINAQNHAGLTALDTAVIAGNLESVRCLFDNGASLDTTDNNGATALHLAASNGLEEVTRLLIQKGANIHASRLNGTTVLHMAAGQGHPEVVTLLIGAGAELEVVDEGGFTPLVMACENGFTEAVRTLLDNGANINAHASFGIAKGWTGLFFASQNGYLETVHFLLLNGIETRNELAGWTALHAACGNDHVDIARELLESGRFDINATAGPRSVAPLHMAILQGNLGLLDLLLSNGADLEARASNGETALMCAASKPTETKPTEIATQMFKILRDRGADPLTRDAEENTCLHAAAFSGSSGIIKILIEAGSDLEAVNSAGFRPLHYAVRTKRKEILQIIIDAGADVNAKDESGDTCLHDACREGAEDLCHMLLERGSLIDSRNALGLTPLHRATTEAHQIVVSLLLDQGADVDLQSESGNSALHYAVGSVTQSDDSIKEALTRVAENPEPQDSNEQRSKALPDHGSSIADPVERSEPTPTEQEGSITAEAIEAERSKRLRILDLILSQHPKLDLKTTSGETALHIAAYDGHIPAITALLRAGANLSTPNSIPLSPLHVAIWNPKSFESVKAMLSTAAASSGSSTYDINAQSEYPISLLAQAATLPDPRSTQMFDYLVSQGAELEMKDSADRTPIISSFQTSDPEKQGREIAFLLSRGASITARTGSDVPVLLYAAGSCTSENLKLLLEHKKNETGGVDIGVRGPAGETGVHWALDNQRADNMALLLEYGADVNAKDDEGKAPLLFAAYHGYEEIVRLLLDRGADIETMNLGGVRPLVVASGNGHEAVVRMLLERGAVVGDGERGKSAVEAARRSGHGEIVELLLRYRVGEEEEGVENKNRREEEESAVVLPMRAKGGTG